MLLEDMKYDYDALLGKLEEFLRDMRTHPDTKSVEFLNMQNGVIDFFNFLCDQQPEARNDAQRLLQDIIYKK